MGTLTIANQITLLRMLLIPAFVIQVLYGELGWALATFVTAGITDALDGLIARRAGQKTTLGAWLDPMADKLLLLSAFIVLTMPGRGLVARIPVWLTVLIISRDVVIVSVVAIVNLAVGPRTFRPSIWGKVATATYIVTGLLFMVTNYVGFEMYLLRSPWPISVLDVAVYASLVITVVSSLHYIGYAARMINSADGA